MKSYNKFLISLSLCSASLCLAKIEHNNSDVELARNKIVQAVFHKEDDFHFEKDDKKIDELHVQFSMKLLGTDEYITEFRHLGLDEHNFHIALPHRGGSKVVVSRVLAALHDVEPDFFNARSMNELEFLSKVFPDTNVKHHEYENDRENFVFRQEINFVLKKVSIKNQWSSYSFKNNEGYNMDSHTAMQLLASFGLEEKYGMPEVITAVSAGPGDISLGSHGSRVVSFYFPLNERHTLLLSYTMLSVKNDLNYLPPSWGVWERIIGASQARLLEGTRAFINGTRSYLLERKYKNGRAFIR